jgi:hypothetical protein
VYNKVLYVYTNLIVLQRKDQKMQNPFHNIISSTLKVVASTSLDIDKELLLEDSTKTIADLLQDEARKEKEEQGPTQGG